MAYDVRMVALLCGIVLPLMGATNDAVMTKLAENYVYRHIRSQAGEGQMGQEDIRAFLEADPVLVFDAIIPYMSNTNERVRSDAVQCLGDIVLRGRGKGCPALELRLVKALLCKFMEHKDMGLSEYFLNMLRQVPTLTFDEETKDYIRRIHQARGLDQRIVSLYEIADMRGDIPILKSNLVSVVWPVEKADSVIWQYSDRWSLCRLLAKWGDRESCTNFLRRCEVMMKGFSIIDKTSFIGLVGEIKDPLAVQILIKELFSDEQFECHGIWTVRAYAARSLSGLVCGFPVGRKEAQYNDEEVDLCRNWVKQQSDFVLKP